MKHTEKNVPTNALRFWLFLIVALIVIELHSWCAKDGVNYCTISQNQHIKPQYYGSCCMHGSVSALGDHVMISRKAQGIHINFSVQHILNFVNLGSCHGESTYGP